MNLVWWIVYRVYRFASWIRYAGKRRLTFPGFMVLGTLMVTAIMGPDTENTVAYQAFTLALCLLAVAVVFSWFFRARFSASRLLPRFGTVGSPLTYTVV